MPLHYETRNNRTLVYNQTSIRVPGSDSPKTINEYIGTLNPATGRIDPKSITVEEAENMLHDGCFNALDLGNVLIAESAAKALGIPERLEKIFGEHGKTILAMSICHAVQTDHLSNVMAIADRLYLEKILGRPHLTSNMIDDAAKTITLEKLEQYTELGLESNQGRICIFGIKGVFHQNALASLDVPEGGRMWNYRDAMMALITNEDGIPNSFLFLAGHRHDTEVLERFVHSHPRDIKPILIRKKHTDNPETVVHTIAAGMDLVFESVPSSNMIADIVNEYRKEEEDVIEHGGRQWSYLRRILTIKLQSGSALLTHRVDT